MLEVHIKKAGYSNEVTLREVHFKVNSGELVGLIGSNGAGKSTTIKSILGLIKNFEGSMTFSESFTRYGYIPEQPIYYEGLTLWEHLELAAASFELEEEVWTPRAETLLRLFKLSRNRHQFPQSFSKGMQQKGLICIAFLLKPDLYIIDEPFIGLDPLATRTFLTLLNKEKERGAAILMSTHVMDSAEKLCDRFLFLSEGNLIADGSLETIKTDHHLPVDSSLLDCFSLILEDGQL